MVDEGAIDGTVNGVAKISRETGDRLRHANTGNIRSYATWIALGVVVFTSLLLWMVDLTCSKPIYFPSSRFCRWPGALALLLLRDEDHLVGFAAWR